MDRSIFYRRAKLGLVPRYRKLGRHSVILDEDETVWLDRLKNGELAGKTRRKS
jgi:hypothetical protein